MLTDKEKWLKELFDQTFPGRKKIYLSSAPGRVNLIGEHTDYNNGFVLPFAIDYRIYITFSPNHTDKLHLYAANFDEYDSFTLPINKKSEKPWTNYTRGIYHEVERIGHHLKGMDAVIYGDIPIGAGLSSSAAVEVAAILAVDHYHFLNIIHFCEVHITFFIITILS